MLTIAEERQEVRPSPTTSGAYFVRRGFSWSGIWIGAFAIMALQLVGGLLAVWANPNSVLLGGQVPIAGISTGTGIWYLIYTFLAAYVGGLSAAQQSEGMGTRAWHAFAAWCVATIVGFYALGVLADHMFVVGGPLSAATAAAVSGTSAPAITRVSPGWMFGGLLVGVIAVLGGAQEAKSK